MTFQFNYGPSKKHKKTGYILIAFGTLGLLFCLMSEMEHAKKGLVLILSLTLICISLWQNHLVKEKSDGFILITDRLLIIPHHWKFGETSKIDIDAITELSHSIHAGMLDLDIHHDSTSTKVTGKWFESQDSLLVFENYLTRLMGGDPFDEYEKDASVHVAYTNQSPALQAD